MQHIAQQPQKIGIFGVLDAKKMFTKVGKSIPGFNPYIAEVVEERALVSIDKDKVDEEITNSTTQIKNAAAALLENNSRNAKFQINFGLSTDPSGTPQGYSNDYLNFVKSKIKAHLITLANLKEYKDLKSQSFEVIDTTATSAVAVYTKILQTCRQMEAAYQTKEAFSKLVMLGDDVLTLLSGSFNPNGESYYSVLISEMAKPLYNGFVDFFSASTNYDPKSVMIFNNQKINVGDGREGSPEPKSHGTLLKIQENIVISSLFTVEEKDVAMKNIINLKFTGTFTLSANEAIIANASELKATPELEAKLEAQAKNQAELEAKLEAQAKNQAELEAKLNKKPS